MSDEKLPRFLQQTTSQLLHQQEALRKRREMLERESNKPPAMRFGTCNPPRSHSRHHGKSPVPPTSSTTTPPGADNVHRELNWSKTEDDVSVAERAPMRFSMAFRPAPTPVTVATAGKSRAATVLPSAPPSPSPREVNTAEQVSAVTRKVARDASSPRTVSPRSPPPQRARVDKNELVTENKTATYNNNDGVTTGTVSQHNASVPVQILAPKQRCVSATKPETAKPEGRKEEEVSGEDQELTREEKRRSLRPPPPFPTKNTPMSTSTDSEDKEAESNPSGNAAFSYTFAVPRFTPSTPITATRQGNRNSVRENDSEDRGESTPVRPAVGEFRTPRPVTRMSTALSSIVRDTAKQTNSSITESDSQRNTTHVSTLASEGPENVENYYKNEGKNQSKSLTTSVTQNAVRVAASPVPTPSQVLASIEVSTEKRRGAPSTPAMSRDYGGDDDESKKSPSHTLNTSVSRSLELRTPSPTRRTKASPVPTAQDLIMSVQVSADRRPCGCERPTPSPENWRHQSVTTNTTATASPPPTPVPPFDKPMTDFHSPNHKCCDRPTPVSLSSQPAGGEARATAASSTSPWPTTENIISSILAGTLEGQRRAREGLDEEGGHPAEHFSNEEGSEAELTSPSIRAPPCYPTDKTGSPFATNDQTPISILTAATHTPSPVPTERQYGQSVLASAEKRRCGRPTPNERLMSLPHHLDSEGNNKNEGAADAVGTSASPQPSVHHLLDSLDVSVGKANTREKSAERANQENEEDADRNEKAHEEQEDESKDAVSSVALHGARRTPSPTPTPEHVVASLQASAEKRTRSAAMAMSKGSGETNQNGSSTGDSPNSNSFQSPVLTPQNVKDSMQKLMDGKQQTRSDAQAPQRSWEGNGQRASEANVTASTSPAVTAEEDEMGLTTVQQDQQRRKSCSPRGTREVERPSPASPGENSSSTSGVARSRTAAGSGAPVSPQAVVQPPMPLPQLQQKRTVPSPTTSDFVTQSAMFFDCVSAPITPSVPSVETIGVEHISSSITTTEADASHMPPQFLELQHEISAISEGRSRTRTPVILRASESCSPVPLVFSKENNEDDDNVPQTEAYMMKVLTSNENTPLNEDDKKATQLRRSSTLLVQPTFDHHALIQHPHEPVPVMPPPTISSVQVPCTPTPPPRNLQEVTSNQENAPRHLETHLHRSERTGQSPLPRPVSLRSQVSASKQALWPSKVHHTCDPIPAWPTVAPTTERSTASYHEDFACQEEGDDEEAVHSVHRILSTTAVQRPQSAPAIHSDSREEEDDLFDSKNDWMDLVEPLRPHTITVSPQGGAVVYTTHSSRHRNIDANGQSNQDEGEQPPLPISPLPATRQHGLSARTPLTQTKATNAGRHTTTAATPASMALTMDDDLSTVGKSSDQLMHTPSPHVSQTPRSSTRGRRSQTAELMAILPHDVAAEVARMEMGEESEATKDGFSALNTRDSTGSRASRLSVVSEDESTAAQASTISQRVSQRPPRVNRSYSDYIQYLEGMARSSAKKTRAAAGKRMQRTFKKDIVRRKQSENDSKEEVSGSPSPSSVAKGAKGAVPASATKAIPESYPHGSADVLLSPMSPSSVYSGQAQLKVSTRLSTELHQALFRDSPPKPKQAERSPRKAFSMVAAAPLKQKKGKKSKVVDTKTVQPSPKLSSSTSAVITENAEEIGVQVKAAQRGRPRKKAARKFVTAKSMRSVKHSGRAHKKH